MENEDKEIEHKIIGIIETMRQIDWHKSLNDGSI